MDILDDPNLFLENDTSMLRNEPLRKRQVNSYN